MNPLLNTDSYKSSHPQLYPSNLRFIQSYFEARVEGQVTPAVLKATDLTHTVFAGLQGILHEEMGKITVNDVKEAEEMFTAHGLPFPTADWMYVADKYGAFPVNIHAVPEGTIVPRGNALMVVKSTDQRVPWMPQWIESILVRSWYPTTVATISHRVKELIYSSLVLSSDNAVNELPFRLHDFGARGVSSPQSAMRGGFAHLINFLGTDTVPALWYARKYYHSKMAGFSIPAAEHSTIMTWGVGFENEFRSLQNLVEVYGKPGAIVAAVSDTNNIYECCEKIWGDALKKDVVDSGAVIVVRPDSGDPIEVVSAVLALLGEKYGYTVNHKGYRVMNNVRVIQGDGMDLESIGQLYAAITTLGWSAENLTVGMGGGLLQKCNRDTLRVAYKPCLIGFETDEDELDYMSVQKSPATDTSKASKGGDLDLIRIDGSWKTIDRSTPAHQWYQTELVPYYLNGMIQRDDTLDEIRKRAWF